MHSTVLSESASLFPTSDVGWARCIQIISFLLKEEGNIPLVDNHKYLYAKDLCCFSC